MIARSHRKYFDPNRPPEIAYEDADAKPLYDAYHSALSDSCREVQQKFHKGRVLCISPHPELTDGQEQLLVRAIQWAAAR